MTVDQMVIGKYMYIHNDNKELVEAIDAHHILVQKSSAGGSLTYLAVLILLANLCYLLLCKSFAFFLWNILLSIFFLRTWHGKSIKKESVVIMPGFGVQLETHFGSGKVVCRFVPMGKILKPVLNECVTPVTCYWSLALILRGEAELMLVFKEVHPSLKILVPVWKALCAATDSKEGTNMVVGR